MEKINSFKDCKIENLESIQGGWRLFGKERELLRVTYDGVKIYTYRTYVLGICVSERSSN